MGTVWASRLPFALVVSVALSVASGCSAVRSLAGMDDDDAIPDPTPVLPPPEPHVVLLLGLGDGHTEAFADRGNDMWMRTPWIDLPDVGQRAFTSLGDLDGDGDIDAAVGHSGGRVRLFLNRDEEEMPYWERVADWEPATDFGSAAAPALFDVDDDGDLDLLVGSRGKGLQGLENIGSASEPAWARQEAWDHADLGFHTRPAVADIDGNGEVEVLVGNEDGELLLVSLLGAAKASLDAGWGLPAVGTAMLAPALADVNGDSFTDLILVDEEHQVVFFRGSEEGWKRGGGEDLLLTDSNVISATLFVDMDTRAPGAPPPPPPGAPLVALVATPVSGTAPLLVSLDASETTDPDGDTLTFSWDFGDGATESDAASIVEHEFVSAGDYVARVAVSDGTHTMELTASITVRDPAQPDPTPAPGVPEARISATPKSGAAPLRVQFDGSASSDPDGDELTYTWNFGDGTAGSPAPTDPDAQVLDVKAEYEAAKATRDASDFAAARDMYLADVLLAVPLTVIEEPGPVSVQGTNRIDRVARWYLGKIGHDLGGMYLYHSLGLALCERYETSLQYSRESRNQHELGGFPLLPELNGTDANIASATTKLLENNCPVPARAAMFPTAGTPDSTTGALVAHVYGQPGTYAAMLTVSDGLNSDSVSVSVTVGELPPPPPPPPPGGGSDDAQGFGASTAGGAGGSEIHVRSVSFDAVKEAFISANVGNRIIVFDVQGPFTITSPLPRITGSNITIEGNGAVLAGKGIAAAAAMVDLRGHDIIVRNLRLRNGGDNIRVQETAYNVVLSHISSTGAADDGISVGYGAHDVTIQWCFLAGNTRSIFMKYNTTRNVSLHHTWIQKQWIRGPIVSTSVNADVRNIIVEDWTMWGSRFEESSSGNMVNSLFVLGAYAKSKGGKGDGALRLTTSGDVYTSGNLARGQATALATGDAAVPLPAPSVSTQSVADMESVVRSKAGCMPRDAVDQAYIDLTSGWTVGESTPLRIGP